eukprot:CAMPEP_0184297326 /NCGR_PEP_ID=MMETSP1049-20130417/8254_1 /TAXON_ID=77928 /ORGANISM="Proteomonas sulcata, Strain CCMP704" /LENGTH=608 /DNA_ID=CAMNT_0026607009 /DNA_START=234 /DNA_END=2060 /DNA_ORIENTATION=-
MAGLRLRLGLLLLGLASVAGNGHFKYAMIAYEQMGMNEVHFTIMSVWRRSYSGFTFPAANPMFITGFKTPEFTVMNHSQFLNLHILSENNSTTTEYGDWVKGVTTVSYHFPGPGTYDAKLTGCCQDGADTNFEVSVTVELTGDGMRSFSPYLAVLPEVHATHGSMFSAAAIHPSGMLDPVMKMNPMHPSYRFMIDTSASGVSIDMNTGVVMVGETAMPGQYWTNISAVVMKYDDDLCSMGCMTMAKSSVLFKLIIGPPDGSRPMVEIEGGRELPGSMDKEFAFRTGFPIEIEIKVMEGAHIDGSMAGLSDNSRFPAGMTASLAMEGDETYIKVRWNKPCVGQARAALYCFQVMEISPQLMGNATTQRCIHVMILEDEAPQFQPLEYMDTEVNKNLTWIMGRKRTVKISVMDMAMQDTVDRISLLPNTSLPFGSSLDSAVLQGNTGYRLFMWTPMAATGGGHYQLCFEAADLPGLTYENCRIGARTEIMCIGINVVACRYAVRPRESLNDVASLFNTDWVQLWALNPDINVPDSEVGYNHDLEYKGATLNTGHMYRVESGDYIMAVAHKFGATVRQILFLNANLIDMSEDTPLQVGEMLCIIPNSCIRD